MYRHFINFKDSGKLFKQFHKSQRLKGKFFIYHRTLKFNDIYKMVIINPFHATGHFLYPLKTSEDQRFSGVFRSIKRDQWHEMAY